ncbi:hypothetical protein [Sphaerisporangium sp. TRM90804]|uniref:hypothetical protein n=1 Tax=Sphaerisporangium sp. TRM90804 TaxID=3031113 RepID=UPI002449A7D1|nr:hypothetical protein [Sphaerisporangium sp. TRM90804]MDH2429077.1 hypothetical protein [Sphaerisporangium sp. TRM90804]
MPGWPSVGRADDQRLVEALRRADSRAADGLYDAYADRLNDYACSVLDDHDAAAEAVHDTIVLAHGRPEVLREPARLRAWLYALTRYACASRRGRTPPGGAALPGLPYGDGEDPELAEIVRESLAEMGTRDREVLLLAQRHGLSTSEVGAVAHLSSRQTGTRLVRARDHLENAAAAVILARTGRAYCPDLSALVDSLEGPLPQPLRKRLTRHIIGCKECADGRRRRVSAERLLEAVPVAFPPLSLRRRIAEMCGAVEHGAPGRDAARAVILGAADGFDKNGFPPAGGERRGRAERRAARPVPPAPADAETPGYGTTAAHEQTPRHGARAVPGNGLPRGVRALSQEPFDGTPYKAGYGTAYLVELPAETGPGPDEPHTPGHGAHGAAHGADARYQEEDLSGHEGPHDEAASPGRHAGVASGEAFTIGKAEEPGRRRGGSGRGGRGGRGGKRLGGASRKATPVFATIACVLVATGAMVVATGQDATNPGATQTLRFPSRTPGELEVTYGLERSGPPVPTPADSDPGPAPSATRPATRNAAAPVPSATPRRTPTRAPTRPAPTLAARLVVSCPSALGADSTGVILVSARNGDVRWTASASGGLTVAPGSGTLRPGTKARLAVEVIDPLQSGEGQVTLRASAGGTSCAVSWEGDDDPPASDPPPDPPGTPDPLPSDTPTGESTGDPT